MMVLCETDTTPVAMYITQEVTSRLRQNELANGYSLTAQLRQRLVMTRYSNDASMVLLEIAEL